MAQLPQLPFEVNTLYKYESDHPDDLSFDVNQRIIVDNIEGDDWFSGHLAEAPTSKGMFPRNFVETVKEPPVASVSAQEELMPTEQEHYDDDREEDDSLPKKEDMSISPAVQETSPPRIDSPVDSIEPTMARVDISHDDTPKPNTRSSFKDRIAAFNVQDATPLKPQSSEFRHESFVKKPYIPPPSTYMPKPPAPSPQSKLSDKPTPPPPLAPSQDKESDEEVEPVPQMSLKERIKMLQQQQKEEQERAEAAALKKKQKAKLKKEHYGQEEQGAVSSPQSVVSPVLAPLNQTMFGEQDVLERSTTGDSVISSGSHGQILSTPRRSSSFGEHKVLLERRPSTGSNEEAKTVGHSGEAPIVEQNEDEMQQSGGESSNGEIREDYGDEERRKQQNQYEKQQQQEQGAEEEGEEEEEEKEEEEEEEVEEEDQEYDEEEEEEDGEEEDAEEARRIALRERMAKISGGMGMNLGMLMGGGLPAAQSKKSSKSKSRSVQSGEEQPTDTMNPVPMLPFADPNALAALGGKKQNPINEDIQDEIALTENVNDSPLSPSNVTDGTSTASAVPTPYTSSHSAMSPSGTGSSVRGAPPVPFSMSPSTTGASHKGAPPAPPSMSPSSTGGSHRGAPPAPPPMSPSSTGGSHRGAPPAPPPMSPSSTGGSPRSIPPIPPQLSPSTTGNSARGVPPVPQSTSPSVGGGTRGVAPLPPSMSPSTTGGSARGVAPPPPPISPSTTGGSARGLPPVPPPLAPTSTGDSQLDSRNTSVSSDVDVTRDEIIEDELGDDERTESEDFNQPASIESPSLRQSKRLSYVSGSGMVPPIPGQGPSLPRRANTDLTSNSPEMLKKANTFSSSSNEPFMGRAPPPLPPGQPASEGESFRTGYEADDSDTEASHHSSFSPPHIAPPLPPMASRPPPPPPIPAKEPLEDSESDQEVDDTEDEFISEGSNIPLAASLPSAPPPPPSAPPRGPPPVVPSLTSSVPKQPSNLRVSLDGNRSRGSYDNSSFMAQDIVLNDGSLWWTQENATPKGIQERAGKDLIYEVEDNQTSKRGGRITITRDVYVLYRDYSQTAISARYEQVDPVNSISFEQTHTGPPSWRQDQLEAVYSKFGRRVLDLATKALNHTVAPGEFVPGVLSQVSGALPSIGRRAHGALIYDNLANATVKQLDEIRPGDIATFRNAKFQGHKGGLHQKYSQEAGKADFIHLGIVYEWDGSKKKIRVYEQVDGKGRVKQESYKLSDLKSGEITVYRVVGRDYIGWDQ